MRRFGLQPAVVLGAIALVGGACGGLPPRPEVSPDVARPPEAAAPEPGVLAAPGLEAIRFPPPPPVPWLGLRLSVRPPRPSEGTAVGIRLRKPAAGRAPLGVEGTLDGRPVRFGRLGDEWFGIAAIPVGEAGPRELVLRYRLGEDSTAVERTTLRAVARTFPSTQLSVAPRYAAPPDSVLERIRRERERVAEVLSEVTPEWLLRGRFTWPRPPRVTSPFGQRRVFNGRLQSRHWGVDLRGSAGAPVRAAARGRIVLADDLFYAGNAVYLDHGHGVFTSYFHLSRIHVRPGEIVEAGQVLGAVGATGRVTGPHLHWSLYVDGVRLDARSLLDLDVPDAADRRGPDEPVGPVARPLGRNQFALRYLARPGPSATEDGHP